MNHLKWIKKWIISNDLTLMNAFHCENFTELVTEVEDFFPVAESLR